MDPTILMYTISRFDRSNPEILDMIQDLKEWLDNGGFVPTGYNNKRECVVELDRIRRQHLLV